MNACDLLLDQWDQQVKEIFPNLHHYQQQALAFSVQGVILSGNAVMQRVAEEVWEHLSSETKMVSHERRMQRFVANERIEVEACWKEFLQKVLPFWEKKPVMLMLDLTPYTQEATIVYLGLLVQSRVLPLAWCIMPQQEEWDQGQWEIVGHLFDQVAPYFSSESSTLLADRGLSCLNLIKLCKKVGWHYVLRIKNEQWFRRKGRHRYQDWQQGKSLVKKEGDQWYGRILLWKEHSFETWLIVVYLAIWWIAHLGSSCIHHGHREQVDRKDRRDKGLLRIGRLWLKAILKKANRDLRPETRNRISAQLANCLLFSHRKQRLCFSIYLS